VSPKRRSPKVTVTTTVNREALRPEVVGIRGGGYHCWKSHSQHPIRSLDTLGEEKYQTIRIDGADSIVTLRAGRVDKAVRGDVLDASRFWATFK